MDEEKEFILVAQRNKTIRINLRNFTDFTDLPLGPIKNVISLDYDLQDNCVFYGDIEENKIFMQCFNGSARKVIVDNTISVEGMQKILEKINICNSLFVDEFLM
jgi:hypothetical protein